MNRRRENISEKVALRGPDSSAAWKRARSFAYAGLFILVLTVTSFNQAPPAKIPPQSNSTTPSHPRVSRKEVPGRRIDLKALRGARLFVAPSVDLTRSVPLVVHFHGAEWLIEQQVQESTRAVLIAVNLGVGSSAYGTPFKEADTFRTLIDEARDALNLTRPWSSITLTAFSAGYGAVRAILRHEEYFKQVKNILLLDGIHASYSLEGKAVIQGGEINERDLDSFVRFARDASSGRKTFILTHSQIFPASYASTTECADYLLAKLDIQRRRLLASLPAGMQQLSLAKKNRFHVFGYAGNTAADHVDHLHAMSAWLKLLRIE